MALHEKIRELREVKGWSQELMAEKMEMSTSGYARLERGESKLDWEKLERVAAIFKIDIVQLIEAEEKGLTIQQNIGFSESTSNNNARNHTATGESPAYYGSDNSGLIVELEKLKVKVTMQEQVIETQKSEIQTLKNWIASLQKDSGS